MFQTGIHLHISYWVVSVDKQVLHIPILFKYIYMIRRNKIQVDTDMKSVYPIKISLLHIYL